ncbi:MAG: TlpA family protein disulfide reductase [Mucilaginibacter sp.]|nr:TlpA family protein disulfide reductase [Mucilaginibacter sp.]
MKKYLLVTVFNCVILSAMAQNMPDNAKYILPDGKVITADKIDSVNKAWGSNGFMMGHDDKHPDEIHLSPMTDDFLKEASLKKANLEKMLNQSAPDFTLTDLKGKSWSLAALKGKTVVLNFWFTTCMPCIDEMPKLNTVKSKYASQNVVFLALGLDDSAAIKSFLKNHAFEYALFPKTQSVGKEYHVANYPTSIVIDPKGIIRFLQIGGNDIDQALPAAIESAAKS